MFRGFDALAAVVDDVAVAPTGEAIAAARCLIDRLEAKAASAEAEYCRSGGFEVDGYGSMGAFLRLRGGMTVPASRRAATRAARLAAWPEIAGAWTAGELDGAKVDVICAKVPRRHVDRFAAIAAAAVELFAPLTGDEVRRKLDEWVVEADSDASREAAEAAEEMGAEVPLETAPEREVFVSKSIDDIRFLGGQLDPDSAVVVENALRGAATPDLAGERRTPAARRADALVEICRFYLAHHQNPPGAARPDRLVLTADVTAAFRAVLRGAGVVTTAHLEAFLGSRPEMGPLERGLFLDAFDGKGGVGRTLDGSAVSDALLAHVTTNGILERLLTAEGRILDHGRSVRTFTEAQRRAVLARDQGCRVEGCDAGPERCDIHHVVPFEHGGRTDTANAVAKCRRCHLEHHRQAWIEGLEPDGTYTITGPTGLERTTRPPGTTDPSRLPVPTSSGRAPVLPFDDPRRRRRSADRHGCTCACDRHRSRHHPDFATITHLFELTRRAA